MQTTLNENLVRFVNSHRYKPMTTEELARRFSVDDRELEEFEETLDSLQMEGHIVQGHGRRWVSPGRAGMMVGRVQGNAAGFAFAVPVGEGDDFYVAADSLGDAMHNDIVLVERVRVRRRRGRGGLRKLGPAGRVVRVLRRANERLVGRYVPGQRGGHVSADEPRIAHEIYIPQGKEGGAAAGDVVLARISAWPSTAPTRKPPEGEIVRVLGKEGAPGVDVQAVAIQFKLPDEFSDRALREAKEFPAEPPETEKRKRRDFRRHTTICIDPEDARDRDDALSFHRDRRTGRSVVMVHIADVSHFVHPDSALDHDARERGCSVYLVSDFLPMLPRETTQGVLSLAEGKDRLAKTAVLEFDGDGELASSSICHSVVRVDRAMSYAEVRELLKDTEQNGDEAVERQMAKYSPAVYELVVELDRLARQLKERRHKVGSVDLDVPDFEVHTGEDGRVVAVSQLERDRAHSLVEEFMLAANCAVAAFLKANKLPGVYRVHDEPDPEALKEFAQFTLAALGREVNAADRRAIQDLLAEVANSDLAETVNMQLLRSMKRAHYHPQSRPHYALHFETYCHFTSPVRRYPDLAVHQVLDQYFAGKLASRNLTKTWRDKLPELCRSSSSAERRADEAEREIVKIKLLRYLSERPGVYEETFDAVLTGVQAFGLFAQLRGMPIDGLIAIASLSDDSYRLDESQKALVGSKGRVLRIGTPVRVRIDNIDVTRRTMDLLLRS